MIIKDMQIQKIATILCFLSLLSGCSLPKNLAQHDAPIQASQAAWFQDPKLTDHLNQHLTAYLALDDAFLSMAARIHLIRHAKHHLDLQYYIWENDTIGRMLLAELLKAADRGVKIRLLIDDQNGTQLDEQFKALSLHPNFSVKIFNPYKFRQLRVLDYAFRLKQINHRMHNKLIIADGAIAVTGGRNISREYFDASEKFQFTDLDILFYGTALHEANQLFLSFWNDPLSYHSQQLIGQAKAVDLTQLRQNYQQSMPETPQTQAKIQAATDEIALQLQGRPIQWAKAHFVGDHPNKIRGNADDSELIYQQMLKIMGEPKQHLELVSAYFVPTQKGTNYLNDLAQKEINIRILTNSLMANDVALVHAFYQKYREDLLKNGIKLYEFKPYIQRDTPTWYEKISGHLIPTQGKNSSSLHAKFFDVDGMVFIGSFNFDPRSANLNSEVGLVVESAQLQDDISQSLDQYLPQIAYQLKLDANGHIVWLEHTPQGQVIQHSHDPETTSFQRMAVKFVSYLPIEWMM